jgi:hypothetical protein
MDERVTPWQMVEGEQQEYVIDILYDRINVLMSSLLYCRTLSPDIAGSDGKLIEQEIDSCRSAIALLKLHQVTETDLERAKLFSLSKIPTLGEE